MILLSVLMLRKDAVVNTVSPLRLIQDHHIAEFTKYGIPSIAINYSVSPKQHGQHQEHIPKFAHLLHDPKWAKKICLLQIDEAHFVVTAGQAEAAKVHFVQHFRICGSVCAFIFLPRPPVPPSQPLSWSDISTL
ncbi:hypothetical protein GGX14DRAFT_568076 [Mycena pura]|uniref:Helicase ATP-binding domain-containing protein n=1 Tax=Mycena pura TaxID=153505 RepID=A0AAD6VGM0_9AGAR|nr:hypothetical protein GGX14DRAFT_568076 [Mycena pura]